MAGHPREWVDEWELALAARELADGSKSQYLRAARDFTTWLENNTDLDDIANVTKRHYRNFAAHLKAIGLADSTRRLRLIGVNQWFKYVLDEEDSGLAANPATGIEMPK